jgi:hypothetical protein
MAATASVSASDVGTGVMNRSKERWSWLQAAPKVLGPRLPSCLRHAGAEGLVICGRSKHEGEQMAAELQDLGRDPYSSLPTCRRSRTAKPSSQRPIGISAVWTA